MKLMRLILAFIFFCTLLFASNAKFVLSSITYDAISQIQKAMDANKTLEVVALIDKSLKNPRIRKKVDKAYLRFFAGYFYTIEEDYPKAESLFLKSLSLHALQGEQLKNLYLNLTQIYIQNNRYDDALKMLKSLIKNTKSIKAVYYVYLGRIYLVTKNYAKAIESMNQAIKIAKKPKEDWLKVQYYAHYMLHHYQQALLTLKKLLQLNPLEKAYWMQLSSLSNLLEQPENALTAIDISYILKLDLKASEAKELTALLSLHQLPFYAATTMAFFIQNGTIKKKAKALEQLGDLFYEAKALKDAIRWYQKSAALKARAPIFLKLAQIQMLTYNYKAVILYTNKALRNHPTKNLGTIYLTLGQALYEIKAYPQAVAAFSKALDDPKSRKFAHSWISYIKNLKPEV